MTKKEKILIGIIGVCYVVGFSVIGYQEIQSEHSHKLLERMVNHCQWAGGYPIVTTDHRFACVDYSALLKHSIKVEAENGTEVDE